MAARYRHRANKVLAGFIRVRKTLVSDQKHYMNAELVKEALERVGNPYVLVNLISQRVRQPNAGAGGIGRSLIANAEHLALADIALREITEDTMGFEVPKNVKLTRTAGHNRMRPQGWLRPNATINELTA